MIWPAGETPREPSCHGSSHACKGPTAAFEGLPPGCARCFFPSSTPCWRQQPMGGGGVGVGSGRAAVTVGHLNRWPRYA